MHEVTEDRAVVIIQPIGPCRSLGREESVKPTSWVEECTLRSLTDLAISTMGDALGAMANTSGLRSNLTFLSRMRSEAFSSNRSLR